MKEGAITKGNWRNFLTLKGERLLLVKRRHLFVVIFPILLTSLITVFLISGAFLLFITFIYSLPLFIASALLLLSLSLTLVAKNIVDWYFHLYILTSRKILEAWYTPLSSHVMNEVLLDRVNCTEIDSKTNGLINHLIDMGDVTITFDRPTHQDYFVLSNVRDSNELSRYLTQQLMDERHQPPMSQTVWYRRGHIFD